MFQKSTKTSSSRSTCRRRCCCWNYPLAFAIAAAAPPGDDFGIAVFLHNELVGGGVGSGDDSNVVGVEQQGTLEHMWVDYSSSVMSASRFEDLIDARKHPTIRTIIVTVYGTS